MYQLIRYFPTSQTDRDVVKLQANPEEADKTEYRHLLMSAKFHQNLPSSAEIFFDVIRKMYCTAFRDYVKVKYYTYVIDEAETH